MTSKKKQGGPAYAPLPPRYYIFGNYDVWDKAQMLKYADDTHELRMQSLQANPMEWPLPCDIGAGGVTICKGSPLSTVVSRLSAQWATNVRLLEQLKVSGRPVGRVTADFMVGPRAEPEAAPQQADNLTADVVEKMISNTWDHFGDILPTLKAISRGDWYWGANQRCKYIEIRIDTRDGGCLLFDSKRVRISPEQFAHQSHQVGKMDPWPHRNALDAAPAARFKVGDLVTKVKGSQWKGRVVGTYSTTLTPEGYAVESSTERGSVQIYPAAALELVEEAQAEQSAITSESGTPPAEPQAQPGAVDRTGCTAGTDEECTRRGCATSCPAAPKAAPGERDQAAQRLRELVGMSQGNVTDPLHPRYIEGYKAGHAAGRRRAAPQPAPATLSDREEIAMVDAAMVEMANIVPPLKRSECARLIRAALAAQGGE